MFGLLGDIAKGIGSIAGTITGTILGISSEIIATTLGITIKMVEEAKKAGCESYEEVKNFHNL